MKALPTDYQTYYVYTHVDKLDNVVYVGMGQNSRAWATHSTHRNGAHLDWIAANLQEGMTPDDWVRIYEKGLSKEGAYIIERQLIANWQPQFNKNGNIEYTLSKKAGLREQVKSLRADGLSFERIADSLDIGVMTAWRYANDK